MRLPHKCQDIHWSCALCDTVFRLHILLRWPLEGHGFGNVYVERSARMHLNQILQTYAAEHRRRTGQEWSYRRWLYDPELVEGESAT
jgi:hypothetical protein